MLLKLYTLNCTSPKMKRPKPLVTKSFTVPVMLVVMALFFRVQRKMQ